MKTARQAREYITANENARNAAFWKTAENAIDRAVTKGDVLCRIEASQMTLQEFGALKARLELLGYKVSRDSYSDFRDSWNNMLIEW